MPNEGYLHGPYPSDLCDRLRNVYWIGGGSCAGKSTIARRLAERCGLFLYATDDTMAEHARRSTAADCPLLHRFLAMDMDERWVRRSPETMLSTFPWFHGEAFTLIIEDLLRIPADRPVVVEGFRVLPPLVAPMLADLRHAVWLLPTPAFRQSTIERRGGAQSGFLARTSDPERALQNLLVRDEMFTVRLAGEAERLGLCSISMHSALAEDAVGEVVARQFGL